MPPCNTAAKSAAVADNEYVADTVALRNESTNHTESLQQRTSKNNNSDHHEEDPVLKWMYFFVCYLCIGMVVWIFFMPASWLIPRSKWHREVMLPLMHRLGVFRVVPAALVTKYHEHTLVHFTHIVPAGIWAGIIPFQLHSTWRKSHRKLHRVMGYVFLATALPIVTGLFIIVRRKLTYVHFFPDLPPPNVATNVGSEPALFALAVWFIGTAFYAVHLARTKQYNKHKIWMIRHVAAGIFVAAQRFVFIPAWMAVLFFTHPPPDPIPQWLQREVFGSAGTAACATCLLLAEVAVHRISTSTGRKQDGRTKKGN